MQRSFYGASFCKDNENAEGNTFVFTRRLKQDLRKYARKNHIVFDSPQLTPAGMEAILQSVVIDLIEKHGVDCFYVGNQGNFDRMVQKTLDKLSKQYRIRYAVVLAYMPKAERPSDAKSSTPTILPDGIELVPPRFAIPWRNRWMIEQANYVVTYVTDTVQSGAAQFKRPAEKKERIVLELTNYTQNP